VNDNKNKEAGNKGKDVAADAGVLGSTGSVQPRSNGYR
jgi:hypothetical protein